MIKKNIFLCLMVVLFGFCINLRATPKDWVEEFENIFKSSEFDSMYMVVTFSGYSNVGHIALMSKSNFEHSKIYVVNPNENTFSYEKNLDKKNISKYIKKIRSWDKLDNFKYTTFGGVSYRYFHIEKKGDKLEIIKRLSITNPDNFKDKSDALPYIELKNFFFDNLKKMASSKIQSSATK